MKRGASIEKIDDKDNSLSWSIFTICFLLILIGVSGMSYSLDQATEVMELYEINNRYEQCEVIDNDGLCYTVLPIFLMNLITYQFLVFIFYFIFFMSGLIMFWCYSTFEVKK